MYTWLMPWLYVGMVAVLYFVVGKNREQTRVWIRTRTNTWLAVALILVLLGVAGVIFWRARWFHLLSWAIWVGVLAWTVHGAFSAEPGKASRDFPPDEDGLRS
ncbi:MAG: hypothetical protein ACPL7D_02160 [Candidatus Sumerlaeaceae bacterium]|jgi:protein-S-isoprenylcysteine O-methyltransferase Ste14